MGLERWRGSEWPPYAVGPIPAIVEHGGRLLCSECFNALPAEERGGRVSRSWADTSTARRMPTRLCDQCGRRGIYDTGEAR